MSDINKIFLLDEFIKKCEKIPVTGWNKDIPTRINNFTLENGTLNSKVVGGSQKIKNRILIF